MFGSKVSRVHSLNLGGGGVWGRKKTGKMKQNVPITIKENHIYGPIRLSWIGPQIRGIPRLPDNFFFYNSLILVGHGWTLRQTYQVFFTNCMNFFIFLNNEHGIDRLPEL